MTPRSTDVFVIGGGPAGLAAAIAARRRGFDVTVADAAAPPIDKVCGEGIMPDGIAAARALGIGFEAAPAYRFPGIRFCHGSQSVEASFPNGYGVGMPRPTLHRLLVDHAAAEGVRLVWGSRVTGLAPDGVRADGGVVRARWIVAADGGRSMVRRWAGLDVCTRLRLRFGFRRHYRMAPWTDCMEIHWGDACQLYITPVAARELSIVLISSDPHLRLDDALAQFPEVARRLPDSCTAERGGLSASRRFRSVASGRVALIGDASGSVDAITGEGLSMLFQQAAALAAAFAAGDLSLYQAEHRRIGRRPALMAGLMLLLDRRDWLRRRVIGAMASHPPLFAGLLAMHVGEATPLRFLANGLALGWHLATL